MNATNRQVSNAIGLVIAGAMRDVDAETGLSDMDVYCSVARELVDWLEGEPELAAMIAKEHFVRFMQPADLRDALASLGQDAIAPSE